MTATIAAVDAARHTDANPADREVCGVGMLERTIRLASVLGCDRAIVAAAEEERERIDRIRRRLYDDPRFEIDVQYLEVRRTSFAAVVESVAGALDAAEFEFERLVYLDSTAVYNRDTVGASLESFEESGLCIPEVEEPSDAGPPRQFAADRAGWKRVASAAAQGEIQTFVGFAADWRTEKAAAPRGTGSERRPVAVRVTDDSSAARAAEFLWSGCFKPQDGPVSRYINRPVSLALSRLLAPFAITPNQITAVSGVFGLASGFVAAAGGYLAMVLGAVLYQLKSIVDGTDGEIARAKYEFTDIGAWLDKFVDDVSHLSFAVGAGVGVWSSGLVGPFGTGSDFWWWVIGVTVVGKLLDSAVWYGNAFRDGELVHPLEIFDWWFEEDQESDAEALGATLLSYLKPLSKGGVFILLALLSAVAGIIPVYLVLFGVGQLAVGFARVNQARLQAQSVESG